MKRTLTRPGDRFGRWTVVAEAPRRHGKRWLCQCECGTKREIFETPLRAGRSKSCGCYRDEVAVKHGEASAKSVEYRIWADMKNRCSNPKNDAFKHYGARGIVVCHRWLSYENFIADMGCRPSGQHTIERLDNNGPYSPDNCRWATRDVQARNTRQNIKLTFNGITQCASDWADQFNMNRGTLLWRIHSGWSVDRALTEPVHKR